MITATPPINRWAIGDQSLRDEKNLPLKGDSLPFGEGWGGVSLTTQCLPVIRREMHKLINAHSLLLPILKKGIILTFDNPPLTPSRRGIPLLGGVRGGRKIIVKSIPFGSIYSLLVVLYE